MCVEREHEYFEEYRHCIAFLVQLVPDCILQKIFWILKNLIHFFNVIHYQCLSNLHNYFNDPTLLFSDLYLANFLCINETFF